jgi:hypothetical protein
MRFSEKSSLTIIFVYECRTISPCIQRGLLEMHCIVPYRTVLYCMLYVLRIERHCTLPTLLLPLLSNTHNTSHHSLIHPTNPLRPLPYSILPPAPALLYIPPQVRSFVRKHTFYPCRRNISTNPTPHHTTSPLLFLLIAYRNKIQREIDQCRYIQ